jgi:glycosyltransferase involved in cell wall biosynthesis
MTLLSVCVPVYPMNGRGVEMLEHNLKQLSAQKFKDFEVVISDDSEDDVIKDWLFSSDKLWNEKLNIKYIKNEKTKGVASNVNNAINNADGEIIQIMCQDDYFYNKDSLQKIVDNFDRNMGWMVSMYMHTKDRLGLFKQQIPKWNNQIYLINTIGTHSSLSFLNDSNLSFDENLSWFVDCEFYYRLYKKYGLPKILDKLIFVQYLWDGQATNTIITQNVIEQEQKYIKEKYEESKD